MTTYFHKKRTIRQILLSASAAVCLSVALPTGEASATSFESIPEMMGPADALHNTVKSFTIVSFYCEEIDRVTRYKQLQELEKFNNKLYGQIADLVRQVDNLEKTPYAAHSEEEIERLREMQAKIRRISFDINRKKDAVWSTPIKDCNGTLIQPTSVTIPDTPPEPKDPLEGLNFFEPKFYEVSIPTEPLRLCSQNEKDNYVVAVAEARSNAGFNMNQASGVVYELKSMIRNSSSHATREALTNLLEAAEAALQRRLQELDSMDALYEAAKALEVEDCSPKLDVRQSSISDGTSKQKTALLNGILETMGNSPYQSTGEVALPYGQHQDTDVLRAANREVSKTEQYLLWKVRELKNTYQKPKLAPKYQTAQQKETLPEKTGQAQVMANVQPSPGSIEEIPIMGAKKPASKPAPVIEPKEPDYYVPSVQEIVNPRFNVTSAPTPTFGNPEMRVPAELKNLPTKPVYLDNVGIPTYGYQAPLNPQNFNGGMTEIAAPTFNLQDMPPNTTTIPYLSEKDITPYPKEGTNPYGSMTAPVGGMIQIAPPPMVLQEGTQTPQIPRLF